MKEMHLSVRKLDCPSCGTTDIDRDLNASQNLRDKGKLGLKADGRFCSWKMHKTRYYRVLANEIRSTARLGR